MKQSGKFYETDEGKMFVRLSDGKVMGYGLHLGVADSIDNYEERVFTEEQIAEFWTSVGQDDPRKSITPVHPPHRPHRVQTEDPAVE